MSDRGNPGARDVPMVWKPVRGLRRCAVEGCGFFALTGEPHCVRHRRGHSVADEPGDDPVEAEE